ncbi:MAG: flavodoxin-dependent (E)-4-hydroxy-3-methylbut-2-enyl-diphosphate synthase [Anaeroplasmataceae bacterium]
MFNRNETRKIKIGNLTLGGNNHIYIQSMCNIKTEFIDKVVNQILKLESEGCEIIRVSVLDMNDAAAISKIKKQIHIPLVADIHFDPALAIESIKNNVDAIRLNPGNIRDENKIKEIVELCKEHNIPIRIGVNGGSLPNKATPTAKAMIEAARYHIELLEKYDFHDIVLSLKSSNIDLSVEAYKLAASTWNYPLHVGITEAGTLFSGTIKSAIGITKILDNNIGNTIRISLTDDPIYEVRAAKQILNNLNLITNIPSLTSCPTCGRTQYNMIPIAKEIENFLYQISSNIHVAVMGCIVNGPGEAREADLGVAGGKGEALLFKKGVPIRKIKEEDIISELKKEILEMTKAD